jgi:MHS family proline/betaine transporter-like MFS transporter
VELYPEEDRLTGYSLAYNLGLGVVGGTTPMMCTWLISTTGSPLAPALYLGALALLSLAALLRMQDRSREGLLCNAETRDTQAARHRNAVRSG